MIFFTGMHHPHNAGKVPAAFISVRSLMERRSGFPVRRWVMDSGAYKTIELNGGYPEPVEAYAAQIRRFANNGNLLAAVSQDYMCEAHMLAITGMTVAVHQRLTIERYDELLSCDTGGVYIMPVLQGYKPEEYVSHIRQYGDRLKPRMWVGVGSVCKRNGSPRQIEKVLIAIQKVRPDLRLHGFGVKLTALQSPPIREGFFSADSMAWSSAARYARQKGDKSRDANSPEEAIRYTKRIKEKPRQGYLQIWSVA